MTRRVNLNNTRLNEIDATPFLLAAVTADAELMTALVGARCRSVDRQRREQHPLMWRRGLADALARRGRRHRDEVLEALQVLLRLGADVNAVDNNGETAMHGAAYKNLPKVVKFLAANGAKIEVWNQREQVRLDAAHRSPPAIASATSSRRPRPKPPCAKS